MFNSKIILGTAQLGLDYGINNKIGKPSTASSIEILKISYQNGIRFLDTAEAYGNAQEIIGSYHTSSPDKFNTITKFSENSLQNFGEINKVVDADREELKVDRLYGYLFHSLQLYKKYFDREIFNVLKKSNSVLKIGVSVYTNDEALEVSKDDNIDIVQLPFNLLDNMYLRGDTLEILKKEGKEVHVRSVFLQGVLLMDENQLPEKLSPLKKYLHQIHRIAKQMKMSIQQLALSYVLQNKLIDKVLIGVDSLDQLYQHIDFLKNYQFAPITLPEEINSIAVTEHELLNPVNW